MKLPDSEMYIIESPLAVKPSRRRKGKTDTDVVVGERKRTTKEGKKKKRSKKTKNRSEGRQHEVILIPECEDCLYLEDLVEKHQQRSWHDSVTISLGEDDSYMSDITDEDEIIEKPRKSKKVKRKKRRPKSEQGLAAESSCRTQKSTPTSTRSLDLPATQQLRRPRSSFASTSGRTRRAGNRTKPLRKAEMELISVISDGIAEKQPSSRRLLKSERPLRRPRSSFEKSLIAKRRGTREERKGTKKTKE